MVMASKRKISLAIDLRHFVEPTKLDDESGWLLLCDSAGLDVCLRTDCLTVLELGRFRAR
jgi:hypothetical protein